MKKLITALCSIFLSCASYALESAGTLYVDMQAGDLSALGDGSTVGTWTNRNSTFGHFSIHSSRTATNALYRTNVSGAQAVYFDGTLNSAFLGPATPAEFAGQNGVWTMETWIMQPNIGSGSYEYMSWTKRRGANNALIEFRYGSDGNCVEHYANNFPWGIKPAGGIWHHIAITRDASKIQRVYCDGYLVNTWNASVLNTDADGSMVLGGTLNTAGTGLDTPTFNGYLGAIRVHGGTLSAAQVLSNYQEEYSTYHTLAPEGVKLIEVKASSVTGVADGDPVTSISNGGTLSGVFTNWASGTGAKYAANYLNAPAFYFDGTTNTVMVGDMAIPASLTGSNTTWTVETWILRTNLTATAANYFSWTRRTGTANSLMELRYDLTLANALEHHTGNLGWGTMIPSAGQWHHVAISRDASRVERVYLDGAKVNELYLSYLNISADTLAVLGATKTAGAGTGFDYPFEGFIGQVRVTTGAKTASEILTSFSSEVGQYLPGTSSLWNGPGGGNWSESGNWTGTIPNASDALADFGIGGEAVTNDVTGLTLLSILLGDPVTDISGNEITLADGGFVQSVSSANKISAPLVLQGRTTSRAIPGQILMLAGDISGDGGLTQDGGTTLLMGNNTFVGPLTNNYGTVAFDNANALGANSTLLLGEGSLCYVGATDAEITKMVSSSAISNRYSIIDVTNAAVTLTLSGKMDVPDFKPVIKRGQGTLKLTYNQAQTLNGRTTIGGGTAPNYTVDGTMVPGTSYGSFVVEDGTLLFNGGATQTNIIRSANNVHFGTKYPGSPKVIVDGSVVSLVGGAWCTIGRGTGTTTAPQTPEMRVINGGRFITDQGIVLSQADSQVNYYGTPRLLVDNSYVSMSYDMLVNENTSGYSVVNILNNSVVENNSPLGNRGLTLAAAPGSQTTFAVTNSVVRANNISVNRAGTLTMSGNSRLETEGAGTATINDTAAPNDYNRGYVEFDGATLTNRVANSVQQWFLKMALLGVGPNGMTANNDFWSVLDPILVPTNTVSTTFTKGGTGRLGMRPTAVPVTVNGGSVYLYGSDYNPYAPGATPASTLTLNNAALEAYQDSVFHNKTLIQSSASGYLSLSPFGTSRFKGAFQNTGAGSSLARNDGLVQLVNATASQTGCVMLKEKQTVTNAWTASFSLMGTSILADGFAFVIHNDPRGITALGASGGSLGYANANGLTNSMAIGFDYWSQPTKVKFGQGDGVGGTFADLATLSTMSLRDGLPVRTYITVTYDGSDVITVLVKRADGRQEVFTKTGVNMADLINTSMAYVGVTAGTGGSTANVFVNDFVFDDGSTKAARQVYGQYGGNLVAAASGNANVLLNDMAVQKGFGLASLSYGAGSSLTVESTSSSPVYEDNQANLIASQSAWQLNGNAEWRPSGALRLTYPGVNRNGCAFLKDRITVTNAWKATFTFNTGMTSTDPADWVTLTFQNVGLSLNFSVLDALAKTYNAGWATTAGGIWSVRWNYYKSVKRLETVRDPGGTTTYLANPFTPLNFTNYQQTVMTVWYNPAAKTVFIRTVQDGNVLERYAAGVDPSHLAATGDGKAYVGFSGRVGGSWSENMITAFTFEEQASGYDLPINNATYLAFDRYASSGTLTKQGQAPLALLGDVDYYPTNTTLRLADGGLIIRRVNDDPISFLANRTEWLGYQDVNTFDLNNRIQLLKLATNNRGAVASKRRVNVAKDFTAAFRVTTDTATDGADGWALVFHNDARGPLAIGGTGGSIGYVGTIQKSVGVLFYVYQGCKLGMGVNGATSGSTQTCIEMRNKTIDTVVNYNYAARTVTVTLTDVSNPAITGTYIFTSVDIPSQAQSNYAYVSIVGATGGAYMNTWLSNFGLSYNRAEAVSDERLVLPELQIPSATEQTVMLDTPNSVGAPFLVNTGTFETDAKIKLLSANGGQLKFGSTTLAGANRVDVGTGTTNYLDNITGTYTMTKSGAGVLIMKGTGTLELTANGGLTDISALEIDKNAIIRLNNGASLRVKNDDANKQAVDSVYLDGQKVKAGYYTASNCSWITGEGTLRVGAVGTLISFK